MASAVLLRQRRNIKPFYRHSGDWGGRGESGVGGAAHQKKEDVFDRVDKKIVNKRQDRTNAHHAMLSLSLENLKNNGDNEVQSKCDKIFSKQTANYNVNGVRPLLRQRANPSQGDSEPSNLKKSPSTPNLNWRYTVGDESLNPGVSNLFKNQEQVVRRRQRKVQRPRPRSEIREKTFEESWIDGDRERRPASYIDTGRVERDYYIQTCKKPTYETKAPSLPRPVLSGLVWHQTSGLFSRWREVFVILTRDCIRCHKISGSSKNAQFGGLLFSVDLVLVTDVRYVERRGYLTLCLEGQGLNRTYLRRTDGIREWGKLIMECVKRKKEEFERDMSPSDLLRYPRPLMQLQPDSWLLSRLSPNTTVMNASTGGDSGVVETETDSGLDSLEENEKNQSVDSKDRVIEVEEMQEVKLNIRGGKCYNMSGKLGSRPKIPTRLCKVTRV